MKFKDMKKYMIDRLDEFIKLNFQTEEEQKGAEKKLNGLNKLENIENELCEEYNEKFKDMKKYMVDRLNEFIKGRTRKACQ